VGVPTDYVHIFVDWDRREEHQAGGSGLQKGGLAGFSGEVWRKLHGNATRDAKGKIEDAKTEG
jgi:hypothetical protein